MTVGTFSRWGRVLLAADTRVRLLLFLFAGALAIVAGFVLLSVPVIEKLIVHGGYYYLLAVFGAFLVFAARVMNSRSAVWREWLRRPGLLGVGALAATAFALWTDSFAHKVLFDEYVLQGTAWHLHATKEIGTPIRAYDFAGTWLVIDTFLDKRPYFFTFLIALVHDVTGYRLENVFFVNAVLAALTLSLTAWLVVAMTGRKGPAFLALGLLATLPVFGQNATGASMELCNLAMIAVVMTAAVLYLRAPGNDRLSVLVLATVLLTQCRYESVVFVFPVAAVVVAGWARAQRVLLPWPAMVAPLLLVPYVWHDRFVATKPILWQLREGETSRFAWHYVAGNLEGARNFLFSLSPGQPNSLCLTLLGLAGVVWAMWRILQRSRAASAGQIPPASWVVGAFAVTITANLAMLMFYYWSRLDEPVAARFALPFYFALTLTAGWFVHSLHRSGFPVLRIAAGMLALWVATAGTHAYARRLYTEQNLVMHELDWEIEQVTARRAPFLLITSKATMPFLLQRIPTLNTGIARARVDQIRWHLDQGTFREVIVSQVLRPTSADGDMIVDPDDELPSNFELQPLVKKRFGGRWIQISRVTSLTAAEAHVGQ